MFVGIGVFFAPEILNFEYLAHSGLWKLSHGGVFKDETLEQSNNRLKIDEDFSLSILDSMPESSMQFQYDETKSSAMNKTTSA